MKSPKHIPPLCRTEPSLGTGTGLDQVVKLLGDPADIILTADNHLLDGNQCSERGTAHSTHPPETEPTVPLASKAKFEGTADCISDASPFTHAKDAVV